MVGFFADGGVFWLIDGEATTAKMVQMAISCFVSRKHKSGSAAISITIGTGSVFMFPVESGGSD
jgi:hypothetical protein